MSCHRHLCVPKSISLQPRGQYCDFPPIIFTQNHTDRPDVLNMSINKRVCYFQPVLRPPRDHSHARPPTTSGQTTPLLPATLIHWRSFSMDTPLVYHLHMTHHSCTFHCSTSQGSHMIGEKTFPDFSLTFP